MEIFEAFAHYVRSESENERFLAVQALMTAEPSWRRDLLGWQIMNFLPTKLERSRLAQALHVPRRPASEWAMVSTLLADQHQDIIANAINSVTFSGNRGLAHRMQRFLRSSERPQRILYCLARYAEETTDRRFAEELPAFLEHDLSDAFLARSFNALFRMGIKDPAALRVGGELVASHIDATNMDRKAAVSAIVYLCFAGGADDIAKLRKVQERVTIPELRRLLNWGFAEIASLEAGGFSASDAMHFFQRAFRQQEPNFTGYGCFADSALCAGLESWFGTLRPEDGNAATRTVLALGNPACVELLATHPRFGLDALAKTRDEGILKLWHTYLPLHSQRFRKHFKDPAHFDFWHRADPEGLYASLEVADFETAASRKAWDALLERLLKDDPVHAVNLACAELLALERDFLRHKENAKRPSAESYVVARIGQIAAALKDAKEAPRNLESLASQIFGTCIGGAFTPEFFGLITQHLSLSRISWGFNALALVAKQLTPKVIEDSIQQECERIRARVMETDLRKEDYVLEVCTHFQSILTVAYRFDTKVAPSTLDSLDQLAGMVQAILEALAGAGVDADPQGNSGAEGDDEENAENVDWSGKKLVDKPILRWNAVLQVCLNGTLAPERLREHEQLLREAMRTAPHVDKRWVVRALVKLGTDDAIKAILYQALQHVDGEFVAHTIKELLKSRHPRAQQALIRCVGRNTIPDELKLMILEEISIDNPVEFLQELRTLEILRLPQHIDDAIRDAVGRVATLIDITSPAATGAASAGGRPAHFDVDVVLKGMLPEIDTLSVDIRSALRTAEIILVQSKEWGAEAVDLSPIVNMHCKAVELTMRETFEAITDAVIRRGVLSRKLDILGYARPIPEKMQVFEDYLAGLPVVQTIPYFSKFKLRKMLRGICLYRPGKRFTLDGPKAFALFFLVTARKQCQFGLERVVELGFKNDVELFEFIKLVHSLQDSRNRAVHEGLTWDAKDDIDSMRSQAYKIIEDCIRLGRYLRKQQTLPLGTVGLGA